MDYFVVETSEAGFDGFLDCFWRGDQGRGLEGGGVGCVQLAGDKADQDLAKLCRCCPASVGV